MNHFDHRRYLLDLSTQLLSKEALSDDQHCFLGLALLRISRGEDANKVLSVDRARGQSDSAALARQKLSFVLFWVASAIKPVDVEFPGLGYTIAQACEAAVPIARNVFGAAATERYDAEYIRNCWYSPKYKHMRSTMRNTLDQDSPF